VLSGDGFLGIWTDPHQILPLLTTDLSCSSPSDCIELQNLQVKSFLLILLLVSQASLTLAQAYIGCFSTYVYAGYPHEGGPTFTSSSEVYFNAPDCAVTPLLPAHSLVEAQRVGLLGLHRYFAMLLHERDPRLPQPALQPRS